MSDTQTILVAIIVVLGVVACAGILFHMASERNRLWIRYQQLKVAAEHEQLLRERRERARQLIAQRADLLDEAATPAPPAKT